MKTLAQLCSWLALVGTIVPAIVYLAGGTSLASAQTWMLVSTVVWFLTVPVWMGRSDQT